MRSTSLERAPITERRWPSDKYEALSMDTSQHPAWSKAQKILAPSRWREFLGFVIADFAWYWLHSLIEMNHQIVPEGNAMAVNSYPVRLGTHWCTAAQLAACPLDSLAKVDEAAFPTSAANPDGSIDAYCCQELATGAGPGETVDAFGLGVIVGILPTVVIVLRYLAIWLGAPKGACGTHDAFLGFMSTTSVVTAATVVIKTLVGRPRPNYFALREMEMRSTFPFFSTAGFKNERIKSFPSGHSATSMASMAYVTFLLMGDLALWQTAAASTARVFRTLTAHLLLLPVALSLWVGVTRVRDYWHFQDDVLAGWVIGFASAVFGYHWVALPPLAPAQEGGVARKQQDEDGEQKSVSCEAV